MFANIEHQGKIYRVNLHEPLDLSIPLRSGNQNPNAFGIQPPLFEPFRAGGFVGSVALGGSVNCENLFVNPHGNGTHTECVGHISKEKVTINQVLKNFYAIAQVVTVNLHPQANGDRLVVKKDIEHLLSKEVNALVIRTMPNNEDKLTQVYSGHNPAYLEPELCSFLAAHHIDHLLIDLPSVDREEDGGALEAHHAFWSYPEATRKHATITEMAYIKNEVKDGIYVLNLQVASVESDASPSKPVLYQVKDVL